MTMSEREHVKEHIELAIDRARGNVGERIDELDRKLRERLDFAELAGDHAPQLLVAGAAFGFLVGFGVPRVIVRTLQLGVPIFIAVKVVRKKLEESREAEAYPPSVS
jgi:hypothetical protein